MRLVVLILLGVFLISLVNVSGQSSIETDFNIGGCSFNFEGVVDAVGVAKGECSVGEAYGEFYCDNNKYGWVTTEPGLGCSMGKTEYNLGEESCCPDNMVCQETSKGGEFQCVDMLVDCGTFTDSTSCEGQGCIWLPLLNDGERCISDLTNFDCGYYQNLTSCENDEFDFGQIGVGTELSGGYIECAGKIYSMPVENYSCGWYEDSPKGKECRISFSVVQAGWSGTGVRNIFSCSNSYEFDECIDGKQNVTWFPASGTVSGFIKVEDIPKDCLEEVGCVEGDVVRNCGEPTIKLPGFSLFALFASLFIIGMYYFSKVNSKI